MDAEAIPDLGGYVPVIGIEVYVFPQGPEGKTGTIAAAVSSIDSKTAKV